MGAVGRRRLAVREMRTVEAVEADGGGKEAEPTAGTFPCGGPSGAVVEGGPAEGRPGDDAPLPGGVVTKSEDAGRGG